MDVEPERQRDIRPETDEEDDQENQAGDGEDGLAP